MGLGRISGPLEIAVEAGSPKVLNAFRLTLHQCLMLTVISADSVLNIRSMTAQAPRRRW